VNFIVVAGLKGLGQFWDRFYPDGKLILFILKEIFCKIIKNRIHMGGGFKGLTANISHLKK
jgi:hypothetical protein